MTRQQLEHIIRASADIADDDEIVIIGSQSILGQFPDAPAELRVSVEADVFPKNHPERWDVIDGSIGEGSPFHETYGYYAQGVAEDTATLPAGWKERLVAVKNANTRGATGLCLEVHDLVISKYVAAREKDDHFVREAIRAGLVDESVVLARLAGTAIDAGRRGQLAGRVKHDFGRRSGTA
jgi:hypothetical protein